MKRCIQLLILVVGINVYGQSPDWSVNVNSYQYSMTFTVFLNVGGTTLTNSNDKVGAFINGQVTGSANVQYNANADKYVAYLTVLSNNAGETINFKIYNSTTNTIIDVPKTHTFSIDGNVGSIFQSYSIAKPALNSTAVLSEFSFQGITSTSSVISANSVAIEVGSSVDITNLIPVFSTQQNAKVYRNGILQTTGSNTVDFTNAIVYQVLSEDETTLQEYTVTVTKQVATMLPTITLSTTNLKVNTLPVEVRLQASEIINGLTMDDFTTTNCIVTKLTTQNNRDYIVTIVPIQQENFSIGLVANKVTNQNNQGNTASNTLQLKADIIPPTLTKIEIKTPNKKVAKANKVVFTVEFSEDVIKVSASDFISVSNATLSVTKITNKQYEVNVLGLASYSGMVSLQLSDNNNIEDTFGNALQISKFSSYEK